MKTNLGVWAVIILEAVIASAAERNWRTKDGAQTIRGEFVDIADGRLWIRTLGPKREAGKLESLSLFELSSRDREFIRRQGWFVGESDVETTLQTEKMSLNIGAKPLSRAIEDLAAEAKIPVFFDEKSLAVVRADTNTPITVNVANRTVENVLDEMLAPLNLRFSVTSAGAVVVTTKQGLPRFGMRTHVYRVLATRPGQQLAAIRNSLRQEVTPASWRFKGGPANYKALQLGTKAAIVVNHTYDGHREIQRRYAGTLKCIRTPVPTPFKQLGMPRALAMNESLPLDGVTLEQLPETLSNTCHLNVELDTDAIQRAGCRADTPLHVARLDRPLRECLDLALQPHGLTWTLKRGGVVLLTTPAVASEQVSALDHRFVDLLSPGPSARLELQQLIEAIEIGCMPTTWQAVGGYAKISTDGFERLTVTHTIRGHLAVHELLNRLRANP